LIKVPAIQPVTASSIRGFTGAYLGKIADKGADKRQAILYTEPSVE